MVKKNLTEILKKINELLLDNDLYPIYFIIKKLYKSKKNYFYSFNNDGYSMALAFDQRNLNIRKREIIKTFIKKHNLEINICKTDSILISKFNKKIAKKIKMSASNRFMSIFKSALLKKQIQYSK